MNVKKNILLPLGLVVMLVIVAVPAVMLFNGISKFSAANQELKDAIQELRVLHNKDPFPSRANIKQEKTNVLELQQWFRRLLSAFQQGQVTEQPSTPTGFITQYGYIRNRLLKRAETKQKEMLPPDFTFGFQRYAEGSLPAPVDVARLMQQLKMIEQLSIVLIDAGAARISEITREEFESATDNAVSLDDMSSRRRSTSTRRTRRLPTRQQATGSEAADESSLYKKQHFTLQIKAREDTTVAILNRLGRHEMFIVVNGVQVEKTGPEVHLPRAEESDKAAGIKTALTPQAVAQIDGRDLPRQQRRVSGPEFETPMTVTIELDVYTFTPETDE